MLTEFARDLADPNSPIEDAAKERGGKALRVRVQPMILREIPGKGGQYRAWKDMRWTLECATAAEAIALGEAMRVFFKTVTSIGASAAVTALTAAEEAAKGAA